jgi:dihydrofolate synthase / folylpolyglutamate synthase
LAPTVKSPLSDWLSWAEGLHPRSIDLGLARVKAVADAMRLKPDFPILTVGGTNGKGSTCALLEAMLHAGGYKVGCYTSPHLLRFNERIRVCGREAADEEIGAAFAEVDAARADTSLTYFEFGTLAAMRLFKEAKVDVAILEVGLGGRLDAVNAFDPHCAVVTSVQLDHQQYLGETREAIGYEKAGIFRSGRPAVCSDPDPPASLVDYARAIGTELLLAGNHFRAVGAGEGWRFEGANLLLENLPRPCLHGRHQLANAAAAIAALASLRHSLPVSDAALREGLTRAQLPGRFQVLPGRPRIILDVAHNPAAAGVLAENLDEAVNGGRIIAVFAMLADKDAGGVLDVLATRVQRWIVAELRTQRAMPNSAMARLFAARGLPADFVPTIAEAWSVACKEASEVDTILVFGSFHTVGEVMRRLQETHAHE